MQRYILATLSALLISPALATSSQAQKTITYNPLVANTDSASQINPFNLAYMAYRGFLENEGISGGDRLITDFASGKITAKDIVQGAIKAHRLSEKTLSDAGYLNALKEQLRSFEQD